MGWARGTNSEGREIGYAVRATCDFPGCAVKIHRGLAFACGGMHDHCDDPEEPRCGGYFCREHLATHTHGPDGEPCPRHEAGAAEDAADPDVTAA